MSEIVNITDDNIDSVINCGKTVLLDFWAEWCGPCQMMLPVIDEIAAERDDIVVGKVNVDEQSSIAQKFKIEVIPAFFVLKNGKVANSFTGYRSKDEVTAALN